MRVTHHRHNRSCRDEGFDAQIRRASSRGKPRSHAAACASLSCSSLVKIAVPDLASVANKSVRFEASSGGGHVREPGFDNPPGRAGERLYMRVTEACQMLLTIRSALAARMQYGPGHKRFKGPPKPARDASNGVDSSRKKFDAAGAVCLLLGLRRGLSQRAASGGRGGRVSLTCLDLQGEDRASVGATPRLRQGGHLHAAGMPRASLQSMMLVPCQPDSPLARPRGARRCEFPVYC